MLEGGQSSSADAFGYRSVRQNRKVRASFVEPLVRSYSVRYFAYGVQYIKEPCVPRTGTPVGAPNRSFGSSWCGFQRVSSYLEAYIYVLKNEPCATV